MIQRRLKFPAIILLALSILGFSHAASQVLDGHGLLRLNIASPVQADGPISVAITPESETLPIGLSRPVSIVVGEPEQSNDDGLYGAQVGLSYDPNVISLSNLSAGPLLQGNGLQNADGGYFVETDSSEDGEQFAITLLNEADPPPMLGETLAQYEVTCLAEGISQINLIPESLMLGSEDFSIIPSSIQNGLVTCVDEQLVAVSPLAPETVVSNAEFEVFIQADGVVDLGQAEQLLLQYDSSLMDFEDASLTQVLQGQNCEASEPLTPLIDGNGVASLNLTFVCDTPLSGTPLTLWTLKFSAKGISQEVNTSIETKDVALIDSEGNEIFALGSETAIKFIPGMCGDLNLDRAINLIDAVVVLFILSNQVQPIPEQFIYGDVLHMPLALGMNVADVIVIMRHIAGTMTITSCGIPASP